MSDSLKIAIIGDYNFTYNSHQATNLALDHAGIFLDLVVDYYWIKTTDAAQHKPLFFQHFDGILFAPGPYQNLFFLNGIIKKITTFSVPTILTGESYRSFIEVLIQLYQLNSHKEKLISDNLISGNSFERIEIIPHSKEFIKLYENISNVELSSSRYSLYPQLTNELVSEIIDIEAYNQFEEAEVVSLKNHKFFVACGFCPQISSTRELPHPIIYTFLRAALLHNQKNKVK